LLTCYSPVRRSSTPKGLSARLACVKHAASVRPEPGSNSPTKTLENFNPAIKIAKGIQPANPAKNGINQPGINNLALAYQSTLLSSQRTNTHQPHHHNRSSTTRASHPPDSHRATYLSYPAGLAVSRTDFDSQPCTARVVPHSHAPHQSVVASFGIAKQTDPLRVAELGPAPADLARLPGWLRDLKSGFPAIAPPGPDSPVDLSPGVWELAVPAVLSGVPLAERKLRGSPHESKSAIVNAFSDLPYAGPNGHPRPAAQDAGSPNHRLVAIGDPMAAHSRVIPCQSARMTGERPTDAVDAVSALLLPFWQLVIGTVVLVAVVASIHRLASRGRSRMTNALLVVGGTIVGLAVIGVLTAR